MNMLPLYHTDDETTEKKDRDAETRPRQSSVENIVHLASAFTRQGSAFNPHLLRKNSVVRVFSPSDQFAHSPTFQRTTTTGIFQGVSTRDISADRSEDLEFSAKPDQNILDEKNAGNHLDIGEQHRVW